MSGSGAPFSHLLNHTIVNIIIKPFFSFEELVLDHHDGAGVRAFDNDDHDYGEGESLSLW